MNDLSLQERLLPAIMRTGFKYILSIFLTLCAIAADAGENCASLYDSVLTSNIETDSTPKQDLPRAADRRLYIKTNIPALGLAISNVGIEADICKHLSFNLPAFYSAWNYFKETIKFRTLSIQPELRCWFSENNDGLFIGGHFGFGYYNLAVDGDYRIQDHKPAVGGGLAFGYRVPIGRKGNWKIEFSVGGGCYKLHNDKYRNYKNGLLVSTEKRTYIGPDQASISVSYSFRLRTGGGGKAPKEDIR